MALAETSATKTAAAAKLFVLTARADLADAEAESAMADIDEVDSQSRYKDSAARAAQRDQPKPG
jgi:hypothetical protein